MSIESTKEVILNALDDLKAVDVKVLPVGEISSVADYMIIASGNSTRHVKSLADNVVKESKKLGLVPKGVEGESASEWVLVDLGDIVVHVMLPRIREFYCLEKLWVPLAKGDLTQAVSEK
jgi:ribosome-associated protein